MLLDAWRRLGVSGDEGRLLIVGSPSAHLDDGAGFLERLQATAPPGCVWSPAQSDVVGPLHAADVVVVPSVWAEPFGRVIVEAMATGRPAVASRVGGIPEILTGEFERFLVEPGDAGVLTLALESLVGWQEREPALADRCRAHVRDHFSLDRVVEGVERSLSAAAGEIRGRGRRGSETDRAHACVPTGSWPLVTFLVCLVDRLRLRGPAGEEVPGLRRPAGAAAAERVRPGPDVGAIQIEIPQIAVEAENPAIDDEARATGAGPLPLGAGDASRRRAIPRSNTVTINATSTDPARRPGLRQRHGGPRREGDEP